MDKLVDFRYSPYKEDVGIFGKKGEGKTTRAKIILDTIPNIPRWIWSPQRPMENYQGYGHPVSNMEELHHGFFIWTGDFSRKTFLKFISRAFHQMQNLVIVVDDVHEQCTKQMIPPEFEYFILSGRNRGLYGIYLSPYPNRIHNSILGSCQLMFAHRFDLQTQIEWMANNFFGLDAWILLSKDKRKRGCFDSENDLSILPTHSVLYRKNTEVESQLIIAGGAKSDQSLKNGKEPIES